MTTDTTGAEPMDQDELRAAIAAQEEHIKRSTSCSGTVGRAHDFRPHGSPPATWSACVVCGLTETPQDYQVKIAAEGDR